MVTAASGRDLRTAGDMAAILDWRLTALGPSNFGPLPWLSGIPSSLHEHPVWGDYLAKRSQLVADLAVQVHDHACQADDPPAWAAPGTHPSALIGEVAVWRAVNDIDPQDPRPTGGHQQEAAADLWKHQLDRHLARATEPPHNTNVDQAQPARQAQRGRYRDIQYSNRNAQPDRPYAPGR